MNRNRKIVTAALAAGISAVIGASPVLAAGNTAKNEVTKEETVYVNTDADGTVQEIIVSDWLKNSGGAGIVEDVSDLENIKNVKGNETFTQDGKSITWNTEDNDIYYQGTTDK